MWKGSKARSLGAGFKLFYHDADRKRNGVVVCWRSHRKELDNQVHIVRDDTSVVFV